MTNENLTPDEQPFDLARLNADTMLLDALGRGEPAPDGDTVAAMLAAWRADLDERRVPLLTDSAVKGTPPNAGRRFRWAVAAAVAAVLLAGGGLVVAAGHATPGSPLWPITRVMYHDRAAVAAVEDAISRARQAAAEGHYDDARRLLDEAAALVGRVRDPKQAQRLRAEIESVRATLPVPGAPAPDRTGAPGATQPSQPGGSAPTPGPTPAPGPNATGGGDHPTAPGVVPSLTVPPLPLPTSNGLLPLPSLPVGQPTVPLP
jgi:hypothetical protein